MKRSSRINGKLWLLPILGLPSFAWANAGLPMLVLAWPAYIIGLIPIVVIETFIGTKDLGLAWKEALPVVAIGNLWSTFLGIPLTWLAMLALEMVVGFGVGALLPSSNAQIWFLPFFVAWLPPVGGIWVIYAAFVILSIPFCIASIWIERRVALRKLPALPPEKVSAWITHANVWSYVILVVSAVVYPVARQGHAT